MPTRLSGPQEQQLHEALLDAFPPRTHARRGRIMTTRCSPGGRSASLGQPNMVSAVGVTG